MIILYVVCVIISLFLYLWLYITDVKKSVCQNVMILILTLSNLGYLSLSLCKELEGAIVSNKIAYLGGFFLPMLYFFTVMEICHVEMNKLIKAFLIMIQICSYYFVCTIGFGNLYYKDTVLVTADNGSYLLKGYGTMHFLYPVTMYLYFAASIIVAIRSAAKKKTVNTGEIAKMLFCAGVATSFYAFQRYVGAGVQLMAPAAIIMMVGAIIPIYHSNLYTAETNKDIVDEQLENTGFITFNRKLAFMGCNDYASYIFDELNDFSVGKRIFPVEPDLRILNNAFKEYVEELEYTKFKGHRDDKLVTIKIADRAYEAEVHTIEDFFGSCVGFTIVFSDETEHHKMLDLTARYSEELERQVKEKVHRIQAIQEKTILGMAQMVESRDLSTGGHIKRTSDVVEIFSRKLLIADNVDADQHFLDLVIRSAPMHDLGKIGVDDVILRKQARFEPEEYEIMKKHAEIGGKMVQDILTGVEEPDFVRIAHNVANFHHEKMNGEGYPKGLKGDDIPLEARIMALADVFDALVSKRCYKEAFSYDKAFEIIKNDAGTHFDPVLADIFIGCRKELEDYYNNCEH